MPDDFIEAVRTSIAELANQDTERKIFAAHAHQYRFNPVIPEDELAAFEQEHGCTLPSDYRAFITQLGNGGPGPGYGILGFQSGNRNDHTNYERLGEDWKYQDYYNPEHLLFDDELDEDDPRQRYCDAFDRSGALYLCDHGSASYTMLIVSGPCKGEVWHDYVAEDAGFMPARDADGNRHTFQSWYLEWLDKSLVSPTPPDDFIDTVRTGIAELADQDTERKIFAADSHQYRFNPVIPEDKLAAFEQEHGCTLPSDYRAFITQLGNGGPGPAYGILGVQNNNDGCTDYARLGETWQYLGAYNPFYLLGADWDKDDDEDYDGRAYFEAFNRSGGLYLCDYGCASYSLLVVSGPCKGEVWDDSIGEDYGFSPATDADGNRHTFQSWYLEWLDNALAKTHG